MAPALAALQSRPGCSDHCAHWLQYFCLCDRSLGATRCPHPGACFYASSINCARLPVAGGYVALSPPHSIVFTYWITFRCAWSKRSSYAGPCATCPFTRTSHAYDPAACAYHCLCYFYTGFCFLTIATSNGYLDISGGGRLYRLHTAPNSSSLSKTRNEALS